MDDTYQFSAVKRDLVRKIFNGVYADGDRLPGERQLAEAYTTSRMTIRKALADLASEGLVERNLGKGTVVSLNNRGHCARLDIIALVAPAQRRFFAVFLDHFQRIAHRNDALVVFVQKSEDEPIEETIFRLRRNGIRNVVVWLDYETIPSAYVGRLRAVGMNIVFFDIVMETPYADCVCLDNRDAIETLYSFVSEKTGGRTVVYVTRENTDPSSYQERAETFSRIAPRGILWDFPWDFRGYLANHTDLFVFDHLSCDQKPGAIICSDGELGIELARTVRGEKIEGIVLASVDDFLEAEGLGVTGYAQPYEQYAERVFACLVDQNRLGSAWLAAKYTLKGELRVR